jgi:hypothetical protein
MKNSDVLILKQMLEDNRFDEKEMETILSHYANDPSIIFWKLPAGSKIIRSSTNNDKKFHDDVQRLNYPPSRYARTDRASLKGKPMFYGTIFTSAAIKKNAYPRIFSALETSDILRDYNSRGKTFTTQSLWIPDRELNLFCFPFSQKYKRPCDEVKMQRLFWINNASKFYSNEQREFSEFIGDLIAEENHSCLYEITARTINNILYKSKYTNELDGIVYPSVWGEGDGLNICLKKETVDKCLHFEGASVQCIDKTIGNSHIFGVANSYILPDGKLKWIPTETALDILQNAYGLKAMIEKGMIYFGTKSI